MDSQIVFRCLSDTPLAYLFYVLLVDATES